jgi:hypothetical protein
MNAQIQQQIIDMHSFQLKEVLNFVVFLHDKQNKVLPNPNGIAGLRGKYRNNLSSSNVFAQLKLEEIKREDAKWQH